MLISKLIQFEQYWTDITQIKNNSQLEDSHFILNNWAILFGCEYVCECVGERVRRQREGMIASLIDWNIEMQG